MDENGTTYTPEEFWNEIDTWNANPRNHFVSRTYREWERVAHPDWDLSDYFNEDRVKCLKMFNIIPECNDFEVDGLRFAVYTDFS